MTRLGKSACRIGAIALSVAAGGMVVAQTVPRSFEASPEIYKVLAQNDTHKVILVSWKPGQRDVLHSHPASGVYYLTDCLLRNHAPNGTWRDGNPKAGSAVVQPSIAGHVIENLGSQECRLVMFEPA